MQITKSSHVTHVAEAKLAVYALCCSGIWHVLTDLYEIGIVERLNYSLFTAYFPYLVKRFQIPKMSFCRI